MLRYINSQTHKHSSAWSIRFSYESLTCTRVILLTLKVPVQTSRSSLLPVGCYTQNLCSRHPKLFARQPQTPARGTRTPWTARFSQTLWSIYWLHSEDSRVPTSSCLLLHWHRGEKTRATCKKKETNKQTNKERNNIFFNRTKIIDTKSY